MTKYLLDTNHFSAYLDGHALLVPRVNSVLRCGDRVGICLPVLFEYRAGIRLGRYYQRNLDRLRQSLSVFRLWPMDADTAAEYEELFAICRKQGRVLSQFDLVIAAIARQHQLVVLTADQDFTAISDLPKENWLK